MSKTVNAAMIGLGFGAEFIPIYQAHPNANVTANQILTFEMIKTANNSRWRSVESQTGVNEEIIIIISSNGISPFGDHF